MQRIDIRELKYRHVDRAVERTQVAMNLARSLVSPARRPVRVKRTGTMYEIRVDGQSILAPWIHRWRYYREGFENRLETVCARYGLDDLHPHGEGEWVVDVGAYMGELTIRMLRNGFNVLCVEPDPEAARCLRKNLERHGPGSKEWIVDTRVCSDRHGQVTFHLEPHGADSSLFPSVARPSRAVRLDGARLDDIVAERLGDRPVRGLKIDAEGAEPEVLAGAPGLLRTHSRRQRRRGVRATRRTHVRGVPAHPSRIGILPALRRKTRARSRRRKKARAGRFRGASAHTRFRFAPRRSRRRMTVNILTLKWGTKYGPEYVNRLHSGVRRHLGLDFRFLWLHRRREGASPGGRGPPDPRLRCPSGLAAHPVAQARALPGGPCRAVRARACSSIWTS